MQGSSQEVFDELFKENENSFCFECGSPAKDWVSLNNGIFLCLTCSGLHRGFGPNISLVRSVRMDTWSDLQLAMMKNGGNPSLKACFDNYLIPKDAPMDFKYRTKAGAYYRQMLKAIAEGSPLPNPPALEEGLEIVPDMNPNFDAPKPVPPAVIAAQTQGSQVDKVTTFFNTAIDATIKSTKETTQKLLDPVFQQNIKLGVATFGTNVANGTKTVVKTMTDPKFYKEEVPQLGAKVAVRTQEVAGIVADKSKEIWTHRDEYIQKGSVAAKESFNSAVNFFKNIGKPKVDNINATTDNAAPENAAPENIASENSALVSVETKENDNSKNEPQN